MNKLDEAGKKLLTEELLGKLWYNSASYNHSNRTFTTPNDIFAVRKALRDKGLWADFYLFSVRQANLSMGEIGSIEQLIHEMETFHIRQMAYLDSDIERFCRLVWKFMEGGK